MGEAPACHGGCVIAATRRGIAASAARWREAPAHDGLRYRGDHPGFHCGLDGAMGGSARVMTAVLSRRPLCLSTRLRQRDGGKRPRMTVCVIAAIIRASLRRFGLTDVEFLLGGREVVPEHVPAADADLQIAVLFGVRLSVAQRVGREDVEVYGVAAAVGVGH